MALLDPTLWVTFPRTLYLTKSIRMILLEEMRVAVHRLYFSQFESLLFFFHISVKLTTRKALNPIQLINILEPYLFIIEWFSALLPAPACQFHSIHSLTFKSLDTPQALRTFHFFFSILSGLFDISINCKNEEVP